MQILSTHRVVMLKTPLQVFVTHDMTYMHLCSCKSFAKIVPIPKIHIWMVSFYCEQCNMCIYVVLSRKTVVTNVTIELHFYIINWCSMCIHLPLLRTAVITNFTFEGLLSSMWLFWEELYSEILHLNVGFFRMNCTNVFSHTCD